LSKLAGFPWIEGCLTARLRGYLQGGFIPQLYWLCKTFLRLRFGVLQIGQAALSPDIATELIDIVMESINSRTKSINTATVSYQSVMN